MGDEREILQQIRGIVENRVIYLATASLDAVPNVVPIGGKKMLDDRNILIVDVRLNKTKRNIMDNPQVALVIEDLAAKKPLSYQVKGTARYFAEGIYYEEAKALSDHAWSSGKRSARVRHPVRGAVLVTIEAVYCNMRGGVQVVPGGLPEEKSDPSPALVGEERV